jgi:hypothetical protein
VLGFANDGKAIIARDAKLLFSLPVSTIKIERTRQNGRTRVSSSGDFAAIQLTLTGFRWQPNPGQLFGILGTLDAVGKLQGPRTRAIQWAGDSFSRSNWLMLRKQ